MGERNGFARRVLISEDNEEGRLEVDSSKLRKGR